MSERHTRQNRHAGSTGPDYRPGLGGAASVGPSDTIAEGMSRFCWCGEQHNKLSTNPKYWSSGDHPWPPLDEPRGSVASAEEREALAEALAAVEVSPQERAGMPYPIESYTVEGNLRDFTNAVLTSDWLAARDARIEANALREAADDMEQFEPFPGEEPDWLRGRANRIEQDAARP